MAVMTKKKPSSKTRPGDKKKERGGSEERGAHHKVRKRQRSDANTRKKVRTREEAAARRTQASKRRVLRKQARKARADHAVNCSMMSGNKNGEKKPLDGVVMTMANSLKTEKVAIKNFNDIVMKCIRTLKRQRKCKREESSPSKKREETSTSQKNGRKAEITIDLVSQARAKMSENKVKGPGDAVVSEMIKQLPREKIYVLTKYFQERSWERWSHQVPGSL